MKLKLIAGLLILAHSTGFAQKKIKKELDQFIVTSLKCFTEIPGIAISVVKGNKPFFVKAYGYLNIENGKKATVETPYYIASTTKSFTALAATILESEGRIHLDSPLLNYAPFKNFKNKAIFEGITIKDLLSHISGIENNYITWRNAYTGEYTKEEMIRLLEEQTVLKKTGKVYEYDNLGYNILDILLQEELGENWKDLLKKKIFDPLEMKHTSAYISESNEKSWGLALPYLSRNDAKKPLRTDIVKNDATMQAAGGLVCSANDAVNWLLFNINQGKFKGKQVYPQKLIKKTHSSVAAYQRNGLFEDIGYGLGWVNAYYKREKVTYHFGGFTGYFSHISFMPDKKIGIAIFVNESFYGDNVANLIASFTYDLLLNGISSVGKYTLKTDSVRASIDANQEKFKKDREQRSARAWQLKYPMENYTGRYYNPDAGTITVIIKDGQPMITMGILRAVATPYSKDDIMRAEIVPGTGELLEFLFKDGRAISLNYGENIFIKIP